MARRRSGQGPRRVADVLGASWPPCWPSPPCPRSWCSSWEPTVGWARPLVAARSRVTCRARWRWRPGSRGRPVRRNCPGRHGARAPWRAPPGRRRFAAGPCGGPHRGRRPGPDERRRSAGGGVGCGRIDADGRVGGGCPARGSRHFADRSDSTLAPRVDRTGTGPHRPARRGLVGDRRRAARRRRRLDADRHPQPRPRHGRRPAVRRPGHVSRGAGACASPKRRAHHDGARRTRLLRRTPAAPAAPTGCPSCSPWASAPWPVPPWPAGRGAPPSAPRSPATSTSLSGEHRTRPASEAAVDADVLLQRFHDGAGPPCLRGGQLPARRRARRDDASGNPASGLGLRLAVRRDLHPVDGTRPPTYPTGSSRSSAGRHGLAGRPRRRSTTSSPPSRTRRSSCRSATTTKARGSWRSGRATCCPSSASRRRHCCAPPGPRPGRGLVRPRRGHRRPGRSRSRGVPRSTTPLLFLGDPAALGAGRRPARRRRHHRSVAASDLTVLVDRQAATLHPIGRVLRPDLQSAETAASSRSSSTRRRPTRRAGARTRAGAGRRAVTGARRRLRPRPRPASAHSALSPGPSTCACSR